MVLIIMYKELYHNLYLFRVHLESVPKSLFKLKYELAMKTENRASLIIFFHKT